MQAVQAKTVRMRVYFCFWGDLRLRSRHLHSHFKICGEAGAIASARCAQEKGNFPSLASASSYIHSCFIALVSASTLAPVCVDCVNTL